jgi:2C-methyl-D-erythritol 2,4-cyclodiphosphate synthase
MADSPQDLKDQTLAQLDALRSTLASADWQTRMLSASPEQKQQSSDAQILADARIAQLEDVQLGQIDQQIDADAPALNDAIAGMQRALGDLQDAAKVLVAASALLKVVGRVLTSVAL